MVYQKLGSIQNQCVEHVLAMSFGLTQDLLNVNWVPCGRYLDIRSLITSSCSFKTIKLIKVQ